MAAAAPHTTEETHASVAHEEPAGGVMGVIGTFGLRGDLFAAQLLNFVIVLLVLWRFAYKPLLKLLQEREVKIEKSLADAKAIDTRVRDLEEERTQTITEAQKEAHDILVLAKIQSEAMREEMVRKIKEEIAGLKMKGEKELTTERENMLESVRQEIIDLAITGAEKILRREVDEKTSRELLERALKEKAAL